VAPRATSASRWGSTLPVDPITVVGTRTGAGPGGGDPSSGGGTRRGATPAARSSSASSSATPSSLGRRPGTAMRARSASSPQVGLSSQALSKTSVSSGRQRRSWRAPAQTMVASSRQSERASCQV
jgi:hypothetical protein